jgi:hypothetical protein
MRQISLKSILYGISIALIGAVGSLPSEAQNSLPDMPERLALFTPQTLIAFDPLESESGWFTLSEDGAWLASITQRDEIIIWDVAEQTEQARIACPDFVTASFSTQGALVAACMQAEGFELVRWQMGETQRRVLALDYYPMQVWFGADEMIYAELQPIQVTDAAQVLRLSWDGEPELLNYPPEQDSTGVVRIGRIMPPYVVTSSLDGVVSLWHMETGERLAEVNNGTGKPAVFGNLNASATDLVWRDNDNQNLYLLNWQTGENRLIANLGGAYVQWFFLTNAADVVFGVGVGGQANVQAWLTETGESLALGDYHAERPCSRPQPDMAHFSQLKAENDNASLAIGCDASVEVWGFTP